MPPTKGDRVQMYKGRRGLFGRSQWRARVISGNNRRLFISAESYNNLGDLKEITDRLFPDLPVEVIE
jgi:hypothetical protein